jgi:hypothetical protein
VLPNSWPKNEVFTIFLPKIALSDKRNINLSATKVVVVTMALSRNGDRRITKNEIKRKLIIFKCLRQHMASKKL